LEEIGLGKPLRMGEVFIRDMKVFPCIYNARFVKECIVIRDILKHINCRMKYLAYFYIFLPGIIRKYFTSISMFIIFFSGIILLLMLSFTKHDGQKNVFV
jgi:hypothetical protein